MTSRPETSLGVKLIYNFRSTVKVFGRLLYVDDLELSTKIIWGFFSFFRGNKCE